MAAMAVAVPAGAGAAAYVVTETAGWVAPTPRALPPKVRSLAVASTTVPSRYDRRLPPGRVWRGGPRR
jgi:hypothetical protein